VVPRSNLLVQGAIPTGLVPVFVLLDVAMPDLDGWQVLWVLRQTGRTRDVPVVMLSARSGNANILKSINFVADAFIIKPVLPEDLVARVRQAISSRHWPHVPGFLHPGFGEAHAHGEATRRRCAWRGGTARPSSC
jgi:DNA-binding response OmpR family regulator